MFKLTVIILASIISAAILQDVNQSQNRDANCARQDVPAVENQVSSYKGDLPEPLGAAESRIVPGYISNPPESLTHEYFPNDPVIYKPRPYKPIAPEPIYDPTPEKYPKYYNNRRKNYPNPTIIHPTSDEIVDKTVQQTTDKITRKDCNAYEQDPLLKDTRRSFGVRNENQNDYQLENNVDANSNEFDRNEIDDPVLRSNVKQVGERNQPMLMNNPRVCYACSSASNPTCWEPNRRTTIKYCNKGHASCVTKIFGEGPSLTMVRDCAASCEDTSVPGLEPKYKTCKVCHNDLCNSAFSIKSYKLLYVILLFSSLKFAY